MQRDISIHENTTCYAKQRSFSWQRLVSSTLIFDHDNLRPGLADMEKFWQF